MYQISNEEEELAIQRYLRLSTKKENDLQRKQFSEEVYMAKKKFHQVSSVFIRFQSPKCFYTTQNLVL
jgi:hypothetical protein